MAKSRLTADALLAKANVAILHSGPASWLDSHPDRVAIIDALKAGAAATGMARVLTEAGPMPVSRNMIMHTLRRIREGKI